MGRPDPLAPARRVVQTGAEGESSNEARASSFAFQAMDAGRGRAIEINDHRGARSGSDRDEASAISYRSVRPGLPLPPVIQTGEEMSKAGLATLGLDNAIRLRWALRDIHANSCFIRSLLGYPGRGQFLVVPRGQFSMARDSVTSWMGNTPTRSHGRLQHHGGLIRDVTAGIAEELRCCFYRVRRGAGRGDLSSLRLIAVERPRAADG